MGKEFFRKALFLSLIICVAVSGLTACKKKAVPYSKSGTYFDTIITITLYDPDAGDLIDGCFSLASKYEKYFNTNDPDSDIAKINSANGVPIQVHPETVEIINQGIYYSTLTDGAFDISVGKLSRLWKEAIKTHTIPAPEEISEALSTVDYKSIKVEGDKVSLTREGQELDLGGIAKGYIADRMKEYLNEKGVKSGLINLGGNVLTLSEKADGSKYKIGIQKPFSNEPIISLDLSDKSLVTSGTYERYFEKDDVIYHHIIDLKTGYPCQNELNSVTILCESSVEADALSTACFIMGKDKAQSFISTLPEAEAIFIDKENTITKTYQ